MNHITGVAREQIILFPEAIEDYVSADNPVRFLDAFVESLETRALGFRHATVEETGRPPYHPKDLLKLYLYGYLNRIRSSRLLERESKRNLEVLWLLKRLSPDHKTISDFRRSNAEALRALFKQFVLTCSKLELFGAELVAIDSTKFKASNARNRVKDREQLDDTITRIGQSISQYLAHMEENDQHEETSASPSVMKEALQEKIARLQKEKAQLLEARQGLDHTQAEYASLTDPDCRLMKNERRIEPAYTMQAAVDAKHSLIIDYELTQDAADNNHLSCVAVAAKETLGVETLAVCADAGYYDTVDLKTCDDHGITTYVSIPAPKIPKHTNVPTPDYYNDRFVYDEATDTYRCPAGQTLHYYRTTDKSDGRRIRIYRTKACIGCRLRSACTTSPRGRYINRWEHEGVLDRLKQRLANQPEMIKHRKAIIEHIFGTIKKIWGYSALLLRGLTNIAGEVALMNLSYNIRRVLNILGTRKLILSLQQN
jgi:transposase